MKSNIQDSLGDIILTESMFWEEIQEAREVSCTINDFYFIVENILVYYESIVEVDIEDINYW
jgi:hypothetical protein